MLQSVGSQRVGHDGATELKGSKALESHLKDAPWRLHTIHQGHMPVRAM